MSWKWKQFWKRTIPGLIVGLIFAIVGLIGSMLLMRIEPLFALRTVLIWGLIGGLVGGLVGGWTDTVKVGKAYPNQGIKLSGKNSLASILITGLIVGLIDGLIGERWIFGRIGLVSTALIAFFFFGLIVGLNRGGSAVIKHYALRLTLWLNGYTPLNLVNFLDHCAKLILLKRVGGGYIFIHRMLLEYFADLPRAHLSWRWPERRNAREIQVERTIRKT